MSTAVHFTNGQLNMGHRRSHDVAMKSLKDENHRLNKMHAEMSMKVERIQESSQRKNDICHLNHLEIVGSSGVARVSIALAW